MIIVTRTGKLFNILEPHPDMIDLRDISAALAKTNRFGGHTYEPYSVAQHCVIMADQVAEEHRLWALMHDAAEAYVGDISKPIQEQVQTFKSLEHKVLKAIAHNYGMELPIPDAVYEADVRMLLTEARDLMHTDEPFLQWSGGLEPYDFKIDYWNWWDAQTRWYQAVQTELQRRF